MSNEKVKRGKVIGRLRKRLGLGRKKKDCKVDDTCSEQSSFCSEGPTTIIKQTSNLSWQNCYPSIPVDLESAILTILLPHGAVERGMMKDHSPSRAKTIHDSCSKHGMQLEQALSLRRHHIKILNPQVKRMSQLGLGGNNDIQDARNLYNKAVLKYLNKNRIPFLTGEDRMGFRKSISGENMSTSPDFILAGPVNLVSLQPTNKGEPEDIKGEPEDIKGEPEDIEERQINWIEAKMYYGASIHDGASNNGKAILSTARKYVENYGPGAFVFLYGCGSTLKGQLSDMGISVLDSGPLNLTKMEDQQRRWCANESGRLLP